MNREVWKDVFGYTGFYQVSDRGRVRSLDRVIKYKDGRGRTLRGQLLKAFPNSAGYLWVELNRKGVGRVHFVHRLVAKAFVPNPKAKKFVNHESGIKQDNVASRLAWATREENMAHAFALGLLSHAGEKNSQSKLTRSRVARIRRECPPGTRITLAIAEKHQISRRRIYDIRNGDAWKKAA